MQNVILSLPSRVSPEAQQAGSPDALKTGHINYGKDLFDTFGEDDTQSFKVNRVAEWANALTCTQFGEACKDAQSIADNADKLCGFIEPVGAKGAAKYGPKRLTINARLSEAKALFGVWKLDATILREKGYWQSVRAARDYLDGLSLKWDGQPKATQEQKAERKQNAEWEAAMTKAKTLHPQVEGESFKAYLVRIAELADDIAEQCVIDKLVKTIKEMHTDKDVLFSAIFYFLKDQGKEQMDIMAEQLFTEASQMAGNQSS